MLTPKEKLFSEIFALWKSYLAKKLREGRAMKKY